MLAALAIRDIVLIERLEVEFGRGLTALTGETGAGKSILLDALSLALGARGAGGLVRHGAEQGQVTAVFEVAPDHPALQLLRDNDIDGDGEIVLRRVQTSDGRTRAFVNDQPVGAGLLKALGATLVEIHGQHDDRALVDPAAHRQLLDAFGGLETQAGRVATRYRAWRAVETERAELQRRVAAGKAEADYLRASVDELTKTAPQVGEEESLAERRQAMMKAEKVAGDLNEAYETVSGSASPVPTLASLARHLERRRAEVAPLLDTAVAALDRALNALEETGQALEAAMRASEFDPRDLERTEERLFALRALARKHNVLPDGLPGLAERMAADLATLDHGEERLEALDAAVAEAKTALDDAAAKLSKARRGAARKLEDAVNTELPALRLERAAFQVNVESDPAAPSETGIDRIEFWVQTNPGSRPGPMMKVASGGELSRFLLALKVALADRGSAPTLVFDEIDTGVGGAVSDAIGQRLARLAENVQVLTVTHAPQVAARAGGHYLIAKGDHDSEDRVVTRLTRLDTERRREEIARMLSGAEVTDEARAQAGRLLVGVA